MKTKRQKRPTQGRPPKSYLDKSTTMTYSVSNKLIAHIGYPELKARVAIYVQSLLDQLEMEVEDGM